MAPRQWRNWEAALPEGLDERERYTATLLTTLSSLIDTAPFDWGLTGGTALQSYLPGQRRRYSTDLEIITIAPGDDVAAWITDQGHDAKTMRADVQLCSLTPDGTLFVIHDYPPEDFEAADVERRPFEHYPIDEAPPPEVLDVPVVSFEFLVATKLYEIQRDRRGGERRKDAYDLALSLPMVDPVPVLEKLKAHATHRGRPGEHLEVARSAGVWLQHFGTRGFASLQNWLPNYVPDANAEEIRAGVMTAVDILGDALGQEIQPTDEEGCRFLFQELAPAAIAPVAQALGFEADPLKQSENARDFVLRALIEKAEGPLPADVDELREVLADLAA